MAKGRRAPRISDPDDQVVQVPMRLPLYLVRALFEYCSITGQTDAEVAEKFMLRYLEYEGMRVGKYRVMTPEGEADRVGAPRETLVSDVVVRALIKAYGFVPKNMWAKMTRRQRDEVPDQFRPSEGKLQKAPSVVLARLMRNKEWEDQQKAEQLYDGSLAGGV